MAEATNTGQDTQESTETFLGIKKMHWLIIGGLLAALTITLVIINKNYIEL